MFRIVATGLTAFILCACDPVEETAPPVPAEAPAPASGPAPTADMPAATTWQATQDRYRGIEAQPSDPLEAIEWRAVQCEHMAGEFGGDNSERDQQLNARMDELRCGEELLADARALRDARADDLAVAARLAPVLAIYEP
ncbi:hypothetical protein [Brevundimonas sp.]|uniref:hypothetical protein n=1 Tax=Brevundimonas sp. TaxID=1871086 RepID=UPI0035B37CE8